MLKDNELNLLLNLLAQPTAPFREMHIARYVTEALSASSVPFFIDPIGNIIVGVASERAYINLLQQKLHDPVRLFIAHMDHPGFHGIKRISSKRLQIKWHGGSPVRHLAGAAVWLADDHAWLGSGRLSNVKLLPSKRALDRAEVLVDENTAAALPDEISKLFGGFRFRAPVWRQGKKLYTKAADDLVGVFCIIAMAKRFFAANQRKKRDLNFIGLLTRAEEVGFIGAIGHFELDWLSQSRRPVIAVSLEASRTLPGAIIGKGPVVRLGDRRTVFDANGLKLLTDIAERTLPGKHQRRIMDGGACEGTAATAYGVPAIALSVPLGNYHNQGFEGGPDCANSEGPAPEFVHLDDIAGQLELCMQLLNPKLSWSAPWSAQIKTFRKNLQTYKKLL